MICKKIFDENISHLDGNKIILLLHVLDPLGGLTLGVNHQRPPPTIGDDHTIVHTEVVLGQPRYLPLPDLHLVPQDVGQAELVGAGDLLLFAQLLPVRDDGFTIASIESSEIRNNTGCKQHITGNVDKTT